MLSTLDLVRLISGQTEDYQQFISEAMRCELVVGEEFSGWQGINSKVCVVLIYLAIEQPSHPIYRLIYIEYEKACREDHIPFVPSFKGLSTILKRRIMKEHGGKKLGK